MKDSERQWKTMKDSERQWKTEKDSERQWETAKDSERRVYHFGTDVIRCAEYSLCSFVGWPHHLGDAKVAHFNHALFCQKDVVSLQISTKEQKNLRCLQKNMKTWDVYKRTEKTEMSTKEQKPEMSTKERTNLRCLPKNRKTWCLQNNRKTWCLQKNRKTWDVYKRTEKSEMSTKEQKNLRCLQKNRQIWEKFLLIYLTNNSIHFY